ncbi:unnamed protein product [Urochloa decumbens]|uniref:F-box domain-containing protein n=1 Tax=Urochloa decumbens TaxID=240449 RepID=A0ABC9G8L5_9POAL
MPPPPPALVDDLVEEILLRLRPDDPAQLLRAALVCKRWGRIVSDAGFGRRFRSFHYRSPPMLGFFCKVGGHNRFVRTSSSCPRIADHRSDRVLDARQGRVLVKLSPSRDRECDLAVWDPITGERRNLPTLQRFTDNYNASVICAGGGTCDRHSCHCKEFLVVFIGTDDYTATIFSCVYSNALYYHYQIQMGNEILKYDLGTKAFSVIHHLPPPRYGDYYYKYIAPMATEDGGIGVVGVEGTRLLLWSWNTGQARWVESKTIRLRKRLPAGFCPMPDSLAIPDGTGVLLVVTVDGIFSIDLKTLKARFLFRDYACTKNIVPFVSFYTPALGESSSGVGQRAGASSA